MPWPPRRRVLSAVCALVGAVLLGACGAAVGAGGNGSSGGGASGVPPAPPGSAPGATGAPGPPGAGGAPAPVPGPPAATSTSLGPLGPGEPGSGGIPTPSVTDPVAGQHERRVFWRLISAAGTPAPSLVVEVVTGGTPCDSVTGVEAVETSATVTLTVWTGRTPDATGCEGPQPALARINWIRVPLTAALGTRTLVPGPIG